MTNLELIELADLAHPKAIVDEILNQNPHIIEATPLEEIAAAAGIKDIQYKTLDGLEGALVANPTKSEGIIVVSQDARHHRQRFTLGHELGHFMIPRHGHSMECSIADLRERGGRNSTAQQKIESEANEFSAELLMPKRNFCKVPAYKLEPSVEAINQLSSLFDVSFQACANRYIDLHGEPIGIVFSKGGVVGYSFRGPEIPFWLNVNKGDPVPQGSLTFAVDAKKPNNIINDEINSSVWFDEKNGFLMPENLIEEVLVQDDGHIFTLLWFEEDIDEIE